MRNLQGKLTWVIARPFLLAILLYLPLSAIPCHAQCYAVNEAGALPNATLTPASWTAGQTYTVTVTQPDPSRGYFYPLAEEPPYFSCDAFVGAPVDPLNLFGEYTKDRNITVGDLTYAGPTQIGFTVSVGPNANAANDYWVLWTTPGPNALIFPIHIATSATNLGPCRDHDGPCQTVGAPINVTNGNVWIQHRDYSVPGLGGGLELVRTWNSLYGSGAPSYYATMFGLNWVSTYEESLTGPDSNNYLTYWRGDGSSWSFYYNSALNSYSLASPPNVRAQLVANPTGGFTLTLADHTQRVFNAQNSLAAIIDRNNNQTTINYDNLGRVTSVASPGGKTLTFAYGDPDNSYLVTTAQDSVGTVATYTYDGSSRLTLVSYPDGSALNFTYDPNSSMILSVTDSQGKLLEAHTYDTQNRGLTSTRANGVDSVSLSY